MVVEEGFEVVQVCTGNRSHNDTTRLVYNIVSVFYWTFVSPWLIWQVGLAIMTLTLSVDSLLCVLWSYLALFTCDYLFSEEANSHGHFGLSRMSDQG